MKTVTEMIMEFATHMKATDHVIMFYSKPEDKRLLLFAYLGTGLQKGEAAAYIASQESPKYIREAMKTHGIDVDRFEKSGALHVIPYEDWYIIEGKFSSAKTTGFGVSFTRTPWQMVSEVCGSQARWRASLRTT